MSAIGAYSFNTIKGNISVQGEAVETWSRRGLDNLGIRKIGKRSEPVTVRTNADVDGADGAKTAASGYKALTGTLVTVTDDTGQSYTNVLVISARILLIKKIETSVGGLTAGNHVIEAEFVLQATENTA